MGRLKKFLKILFGISLLPSAAVVTFLFLNSNGFFNVDNIEINVENSVEQVNYLRPLVKKLDEDLESFRGNSLWNVDIDKLHDQLIQQGWIEEFAINRKWPSKIQVSIKAKKIGLLLMTHSQRFIPITKDGESLTEVDLKRIPNVAILRGENFENNIELRQKALKLIQELPKQGPFSEKNISEIHYNDHNGFWVTLIKDGLNVKMGQDQWALKSSRVSQVLDYVESHQLNARVIDANLSKKVLVRLRKGP